MVASLIALSLAQSSIGSVLDGESLQGSIAGTCVISLDGKEVYGRHADVRLVPASNQKILTAVFAIATLGLEFKPKTRIWKEKNYVFVDASGDPTITKEQLEKARKALGLGKDLAVRVRQPYRPVVPPSWEHDDLPNRYAARVTAFSFDRGGFEIWSENGRLRPLDPVYKITVRHTAGGSAAKIDYRPEQRLAIVTGNIPDGTKMIEAFAMPDPDTTAARVLGGTIVHTDQAPPTRKPDYVIEGPSLREILKECLEKSDNNFAENLLLMSATKVRALGTESYADAADRMREFFEKTVGVKEGGVRPVDGSGMSRHNLVTPRAMCQILAWAYRQSWRGDFLRTLAESGEGTLESRLRSSTFIGKTGTLSAVTCLSGYVRPGSDQTMFVSMLFNNTIAPASEVRTAQDRVIAILEKDSK